MHWWENLWKNILGIKYAMGNYYWARNSRTTQHQI